MIFPILEILISRLVDGSDSKAYVLVAIDVLSGGPSLGCDSLTGSTTMTVVILWGELVENWDF